MPSHASPELDVEVVPCLSDNYSYIICDPQTNDIAVVDPGEAAPLMAALKARDIVPTHILLTHHHPDHIDGVAEMVEAYPEVKVIGAKADAHRLPPLHTALPQSGEWQFGAQTVQIIDSPGHTVGHISFSFPRGKALFCADALFVLGCGRLFEGTPEQAWETLCRFAELPPETRVYCGHEYTLGNAEFSLTIEPGNAALVDRVEQIRFLRSQDKPTIPSSIGRELATNPFMRANQPGLKAALGMEGQSDAAVFTEIRTRKDNA